MPTSKLVKCLQRGLAAQSTINSRETPWHWDEVMHKVAKITWHQNATTTETPPPMLQVDS